MNALYILAIGFVIDGLIYGSILAMVIVKWAANRGRKKQADMLNEGRS